MSIEPDTKDWTWVLGAPCTECGLAVADVPPAEVGARARQDLPRWEAVLRRVEARERPAPQTWSPLEYACHVRDVNEIFGNRVRLMLDEVDPLFDNWDQDAAALTDDYACQLPSEVSTELVAAGLAIADAFEAVPDDAWQRTGRRSNGSEFTIATLAQYYLHDVFHHLHDVHG